ncbi:MAG: hypothetical protein JW940_00130 [Polyangiaceae bacterium]|nr:hypothetical protein [Polyangiaceae bacterium]
MMRKPLTADGYSPELALQARRMCLYVATILGDLIDDLVVVGGLVPYLIIDQDAAVPQHVGTRDLDLGFSLALLDGHRYREISARLRDRGFGPGRNRQGNETRQTWVLPDSRVSIDFLIPQPADGPAPGKLQNLESDLAAIVTPALPLAFRGFIQVTIDDRTPTGELARRTVRVCGPAAFVVMKALALRLRGENKDAYDLTYVLLNFGGGPQDVVDRFRMIEEAPDAQSALALLAEDFASPDHIGPRRAAGFLNDPPDPARQADAFGAVQEFLARVGRS